MMMTLQNWISELYLFGGLHDIAIYSAQFVSIASVLISSKQKTL